MSVRSQLVVGDRVLVHGGYDMDPAWLAHSPGGYSGRVVELIPGQNAAPAAVVALDDELVLPDGAGAVRGSEIRGVFLVLELGHTGADWSTPRPRIHVELCRDRPAADRWENREQGVWLESHATYSVTG